MTRSLSPTDQAQTASEIVGIVRLLKIVLPSTTLLLTDGDMPYAFAGDTYTPDGRFGDVHGYNESVDLAPHAAQIEISGVDTAAVSALITQNVAWAQITYTIGFTDPNHLLLDTPSFSVTLFLGDVTITKGPHSGSVLITGENRIADMRDRHSGVIAQPADQYVRAAGDTFFDQIAMIQNKVIYWGGQAPTGIGVPVGRGVNDQNRDSLLHGGERNNTGQIF